MSVIENDMTCHDRSLVGATTPIGYCVLPTGSLVRPQGPKKVYKGPFLPLGLIPQLQQYLQPASHQSYTSVLHSKSVSLTLKPHPCFSTLLHSFSPPFYPLKSVQITYQ